MTVRRRFSPSEYDRVAKAPDTLADMIHEHPEMKHHRTERLKPIVGEMRGDTTAEDLKLQARLWK